MHDRADWAAAFGWSVRQRRRELGLRQEELADLAGTSQRFVHTLEAGKGTVRLDKVMAVLGVLGLGLRVVEGDGEVRPAGADPDPA